MRRTGRLVVAGVAALGLALAGAGCGGDGGGPEWDGTGTVIEKDYDAAKLERTRDCLVRKNGSCKTWGPYYTKVVEAAEWDITVRDAAGDEHEVDVTEEQYADVSVGDPWPRG